MADGRYRGTGPLRPATCCLLSAVCRLQLSAVCRLRLSAVYRLQFLPNDAIAPSEEPHSLGDVPSDTLSATNRGESTSPPLHRCNASGSGTPSAETACSPSPAR